MDIDGLIEWKNKAYIIIELKYNDNKLLYGQKLALERLTDDLTKTGKKVICIIASHQTTNCNEDVIVAYARVTSYIYSGKWIENGIINVKDLINWFLSIVP